MLWNFKVLAHLTVPIIVLHEKLTFSLQNMRFAGSFNNILSKNVFLLFRNTEIFNAMTSSFLRWIGMYVRI